MRDHNPAIVAAIAETMITTDIHPAGADVNVLRTYRTS
jgi:hypothetical protein